MEPRDDRRRRTGRQRWYLLVEPGPPVTLVEFEPADGSYTRVTEHTASAPLRLGAVLDLDALGT